MKSLHFLRALSIAAMLCAALGLPTFAVALHKQSPPVTQVTSQTSGTIGKSSVWGEAIWTFQASGDSLGNGNATPELFTYEHDIRVLGGAQGITQITCGGFSPDNPAMSKPSNVIAFDAIGTLCSDGRNNCRSPFDASSTARQIFLYDSDTGLTRQITRCPGDCVNPHLSGKARMVVFESMSDVLGANGGSPYPATNVYQGNLSSLGSSCQFLPCGPEQIDRGVKNLTPIGGGRNASQSSNGKLVAFESDGDPLNNGANPGSPHVYVLNVKKGTLLQVPSESALRTLPARNPSISQNGKLVAYEIDIPRPGPPPTVITEIYASKIRNLPPAITQSLTSGAAANSWNPSMGPTGRRVSFTSAADLLTHGTTGSQVFSYLFKGKAFNAKGLLQVTGGPSGADAAVQSSTWFVGFASSDDFVSAGNTTPQFYVANLYKRAPGSMLSPRPGTPTPQASSTPSPTPVAGIPAHVALALVANQAVNNGDNTLTTVIAATVVDYFGNPVLDGIRIAFSVAPPFSGIVVGSGLTNTDPECDVTMFEQQTGVQIQNRPGVAHACLTYPGALSGTDHAITAGPKQCVGGVTPGAPCTDAGDCVPTHHCSHHTQTTCAPSNGNSDCPSGETCETEAPACEIGGIAAGQGSVILPTAVNECVASGNPCSDANPCTLNDVCAGGTNTCVGGPNAGNACTSDAECAPEIGGYCQLPTCQPGTLQMCPNDSNLCTSDVCDPFTGQCGAPTVCLDDGNPCTDDACDPGTGSCGIPNNAPCTDDNPCSVADACSAGACVPGSPTICPDDGNSCTLDICNPGDGTCGIRFEPCACSAP